jgi:hypothetical protein
MTQDQINTYRYIDELLQLEWDPIGLDEFDQASDEYYACLPEIFKLKDEEADIETMAQSLFRIETELMGKPGDIAKCRLVAEKIVEA